MNARWMGWGVAAGLLIAGAALAAPQRENGRAGGDRSDAVQVQDDLGAPPPSDEGEAWTADVLGAADEPGEPAFDDDGPGGPGGPMRHPDGAGFGGPGGHHGMHRMGGGGPGPRMIAALDLTEAQRTQMAEIHDRQARKVIELRADLQIAGLDLRKLLHDDTPDRKAIDAQVDRIADLRAAMMKARITTQLEARAVLTPEQLEKARRLHQGFGHAEHDEGMKNSR